MKPKTKRKRTLAAIVAVLLILTVLLAFESRRGDPLSRRWAEHRAVDFAENLYPDQTFSVAESRGGGKFRYMVDVQSDQSADTHFEVDTYFWFLTTDDLAFGQTGHYALHETCVDRRYNTRDRLQQEAAEQAADALRAADMAPEQNGDAGVSATLFYGEGREDYADVLTLDQPFTAELLQTAPACLSVSYYTGSDPTEADLTAALQKTKRIIEQNGLLFSHYEVTLYNNNAEPDDLDDGHQLVSGVVSAAEIDTQSAD